MLDRKRPKTYLEAIEYSSVFEACGICDEPLESAYIFCAKHLDEWRTLCKEHGNIAARWPTHSEYEFFTPTLAESDWIADE